MILAHKLRLQDAGELKHPEDIVYPIQKITKIYNKGTKLYNFVTKLENSSWNVLCLLLCTLERDISYPKNVPSYF